MHTRDEKIGKKRAARRDRRGPENSTCGLNSVGESLWWCSNLMPSQDIGSVPHEVGVMCVGQSPAWRIKHRWSRYHYCHLGARAACLARDFRWEFSHALPVRAVDGRHVLQCSWLPLEWDTTHTRTERETRRAGEGWPHGCRDSQWLRSTVGELIVIKCWSRHAVACSV